MRILTGMVPMKFTVEEYIRANCEYPREWDGKILSLDEYWEDDGAAPQWRFR